jgi:hypothetical protein
MKKPDARRPSAKWESPRNGKRKPRYLAPKGKDKHLAAKLARRQEIRIDKEAR